MQIMQNSNNDFLSIYKLLSYVLIEHGVGYHNHRLYDKKRSIILYQQAAKLCKHTITVMSHRLVINGKGKVLKSDANKIKKLQT